jgi:hypothetical protein
MESYISVMRDARWAHWKRDYRVNKPAYPLLPGKQSILDGFLAHYQNGIQRDEFGVYYTQTCAARLILRSLSISWGDQGNFPTLFQDALDKLAIPAMSAEYDGSSLVLET